MEKNELLKLLEEYKKGNISEEEIVGLNYKKEHIGNLNII